VVVVVLGVVEVVVVAEVEVWWWRKWRSVASSAHWQVRSISNPEGFKVEICCYSSSRNVKGVSSGA
jgi:hypothetical protein